MLWSFGEQMIMIKEQPDYDAPEGDGVYGAHIAAPGPEE
jgi:hypothetical protein